jgi:chemotaxis protein CheD
MNMTKILNVGMGEIHTSKIPGTTITAPGLGSCIALIMYDPNIKAAGMAHVVLPDSTSAKHNSMPGKYADTAVPELLNSMISLGAKKNNLIIKATGGAQMFNLEKGSNILNIGMRNIVAIKALLSQMGLTIKAADTGGNRGRTVKIDVATGYVTVKILGQEEIEL